MKNFLKPLFYAPLLFVVVVGNVQAATVSVPKITKVSVTPSSAKAGTTFKFSATLNAVLTTGNKVKINLGKGFEAMTGTKKSYSLSRAVYTTGGHIYKVAIVNAKNVVQGVAKSGTYTVTSAVSLNHAPTLTLINADKLATANATYTVTLNAKDADANLSSITMDWGDSTPPDTLTATNGKNLVFSHTYATAGAFSWSAFATDKSSPTLNSKSVFKTLDVSAPPTPIAHPAISGNWSVHEVVDKTNCGIEITTNDYTAAVSTMDNSVVFSGLGRTLTGLLDGNVMTYEGVFPENNGTVTMSGKATYDNGIITGNDSWTWSGMGLSCSGTRTFSGSKLS